MLKPSVLLSASAATGRKLYALPAVTELAGTPLIVGARLAVRDTVIENAGSATFFAPSVTMIAMFEYVPTLAAVGVPLKRPDNVLNVAHAGRLTMLKRSGSPSASRAAGWNA